MFTKGKYKVRGLAIYSNNTKIAQCCDSDSNEVWPGLIPKGNNAPEFREACKYALDCCNGPISGLTLKEAHAKALKMLSDAIAKAEGK